MARLPRIDNPGGRPRKYASDAERSAAFRERWARKTFRMDPETARTIERLSEFADESESTVLHSLVTFALLNRSWFTLGLFGKRLAGEQQGKRRRTSQSAESQSELESEES